MLYNVTNNTDGKAAFASNCIYVVGEVNNVLSSILTLLVMLIFSIVGYNVF